MDSSNLAPENKNVIALLALLVGVAVCIAVGIFWYNYTKDLGKLTNQLVEISMSVEQVNAELATVKDKAKRNQNAIIKLAFDNIVQQKRTVDFTSSQMQDIGSGFFVGKLEMKKHLTGIKFSGRMINTQSVRHRNVTFTIKVDKKEKDFTINMISPGNSTAFSVYVPDIAPEDAHYGEIQYKQSSVEYYVK